jgi:hypothetical protein
VAANWPVIELALRAWVKAGSGLGDEFVIWANQSASRPAGPHITLKLDGPLTVGLDGVDHNYDENRPEGEEIELKAEGTRELIVMLQAFGGDPTGSSSARALLSKVLTALALPTRRDALAAAGVTPFDAGQVQDLTALLETKFESRAALEARFYLVDDASEFTTYIEKVVAEDTTTDTEFTIPE